MRFSARATRRNADPSSSISELQPSGTVAEPGAFVASLTLGPLDAERLGG
jgi:hypothetical protein